MLLGLSFLMVLSACAQSDQVKKVNSTEVSQMIAQDTSYVVLDVRTPDEFNAGHIEGALNIDVTQSDAFMHLDKLNPNAKYIVHCNSNNRSKIAIDYMKENGFKTIYNMQDGYQGWNQNGLPLVKE